MSAERDDVYPGGNDPNDTMSVFIPTKPATGPSTTSSRVASKSFPVTLGKEEPMKTTVALVLLVTAMMGAIVLKLHLMGGQ